jgi:hypothetical protein
VEHARIILELIETLVETITMKTQELRISTKGKKCKVDKYNFHPLSNYLITKTWKNAIYSLRITMNIMQQKY